MKLNVQGIHEIKITDPKGLCNPPAPQLPPPIQQAALNSGEDASAIKSKTDNLPSEG